MSIQSESGKGKRFGKTLRANAELDGRRIVNERELLSLTQEGLALKAGLTTRTVRSCEQGKTVSIHSADCVAQALGFDNYTSLLPFSADMERLRKPTKGHNAGGTRAVATASVPYHLAKLIGREQLFAKYVALLCRFADASNKREQNIAALHGMPGIGKTSIAVALAYDASVDAAFDRVIIWHSLGKRCDPMRIIHTSCQLLGVTGLLDGIYEEFRNGSAGELAHSAGDRLRGHLLRSNRKALFIFDDVWHARHLDPLLIAGGHCASIFTTRYFSIAHRFAPSGQFDEPLRLTDEEALAMLSQQVGSELIARHQKECRALLKKLDGLPLAIKVAGGALVRAEKQGHSVKSLLNKLKRQTEYLLHQPVPADVRRFLKDVQNDDVVALFRLSTDELDEQTRRCFVELAPMIPPNQGLIGLKIMATGWGLSFKEARGVADRLVDAGLLQFAKKAVGDSFYYMHDLIIQHARTLEL